MADRELFATYFINPSNIKMFINFPYCISKRKIIQVCLRLVSRLVGRWTWPSTCALPVFKSIINK